jgi:ThiF family
MNLTDYNQIVLVGLGGVGTHLASPLCRYLAHKAFQAPIILIDGDVFEPRNRERQEFLVMGNKAEVTGRRLREYHDNIHIETRPVFLTEDNIFLYIEDRSIVFSMVDNHATHKLLSNHVSSLDDCLLISGGNDEVHDGNVQIYVRAAGDDITPPLTHLHPEIEEPQDRNPGHMTCDERAASGEAQLIFGNFEVASRMLSAFWLVTENGIVYSESFFDLMRGTQRSVLRS